MNTETIIAREALQLIKNAEHLSEQEGLPYLNVSACLLKTATDISYGLSLEDAVKRQFDPADQFEMYAVLSNIVKEAEDTEATEKKPQQSPTFLGQTPATALTSAGIGLGTGAATYGLGRHLIRSAARDPGFLREARLAARQYAVNAGYNPTAIHIVRGLRGLNSRFSTGAGLGAAIAALSAGSLYNKYKNKSNDTVQQPQPDAPKTAENREPSLADRILSNAATGAAYGGTATGLGFGGVTKMMPGTPLVHALQSAGIGTAIGTGIGGTIGAGKGVAEHLYHKYRKQKQDKQSD